MPDHPLTARTLTADQLRDFPRLIHSAFYAEVRPDELEQNLALYDADRTHGVFDGDTMVGGGTMLVRSMTLPGAGPAPIAAITSVGVAPGHRRRGALGTLMRAQLHGLHERGDEPVAVLWASEGGIYGRFGYGLASMATRLSVQRGATLRADVDPGTERVTVVDAQTAAAPMRKLHAEYASSRIGGLSRPEVGWSWQLADAEHNRNGYSHLHFAVVSGGYVRFRVKENWEPRHGPQHEVRVSELVSLTPQAHAALWRFLAGLDLAGSAFYQNAPADDPLPLMLDNPRMAALDLSDGMYVRLVDVDRALAARRYAAPLDVVFELADEFCPWNAGRWRMVVDGAGVAEVERTDAEPDLVCGTIDLGAAYLGSTRISSLAAAGRVHERQPGALRAATAAFAGEHEPHCLEVF